ncbi:hypothetical protein FKW77_003084 [Venturia effusa]|uniref:Uncharacterized protein n=1 Tax=Venturia effusa TaxID=50376 RepID=A0A517LJW6_9PEZI|nr:hypothetical protein FKW77_003084 [Venturia effusa]
MYQPNKKPYSPIKHAFPRRYLDPSRLALIAVPLLLLFFFFFRFEAAETKSVTDDVRRIVRPVRALPGFRPLNESRIAIVTFTTEQKSYTHLSLKNKAYYAKKNGYDFYIDYESNNHRGMMWHKFDMVQKVINGSEHDWIWWMDFDTLITNTNIKVEDILAESLANATDPDSVDYIFTPDCFELNAGSFLTRASPRSHTFINRVAEYHKANATYEHQLSEQDCMRDILFQSSFMSNQFVMIPQWKMNAFPEEIPCYDKDQKMFERGVFMLHFAGAWAHVKEEDPTGYLMKKYEREIIW